MQEEFLKYNKEQQEQIIKFGLQFYYCMSQSNQQNINVQVLESPLNQQLKQISNPNSIQNVKEQENRLLEQTGENKYIETIIKRQQEDTKQSINKICDQLNQGQNDLQIVKELSDAKSFIYKIYANQVEQQQKIDSIYGNSAKKGQQAEQQVEHQIQQQYPQAIITNTSKTTNSGDLIVSLNNKRILIEIKNYGSTVPQKEVDKFLNDISTSQCESGIFISFNQRIVGKPRISFETSEQNKQLVYLSQQENSELLLLVIEMLLQYNSSDIQTFETMQRQQKIAKDTISESIKQIKKQKLSAEKQVKELQNLLNSLMQLENCLLQITSQPNVKQKAQK